VALVVLLAACGGDTEHAGPAASRGSAGCAAEVAEPLDPGSTQHLLPGAPEPAYASVAPTSGPHQGGPALSGVQAQVLTRPLQVAVLEQGRVLVQYRPTTSDEQRRLEALAGAQVVVAPNPALPSPIVATAWLHRLECQRPDPAGPRDFIARHATGRPVG